MRKEDVVGHWDEKRSETATWTSDHRAPLHPPPPIPNSTPPTPDLLERHSQLSAPLFSRHPPSKTNSPAIPLALPSWTTGVLKGPEEVEVEVEGVREGHSACACVTGMNVDVSVPLGLLTAWWHQHVPALLSQRRRGRNGRPPWDWHLTTEKECSHLIAKC